MNASIGTAAVGRCHWFVSVVLRFVVISAVAAAAAADSDDIRVVADHYNNNVDGKNNHYDYGDGSSDPKIGTVGPVVECGTDRCSDPTPSNRSECGIRNPWYRTSVTCIKIVSAMFAFMTLITYMYVLKQLDRINYVKHYAACLTVSMGLNPLEDVLFQLTDDRRPDSFEHKIFDYLKFFVHLCTHNWQVVTSYEVFLFLWNINFNQVNKFHKNMIDRNKSYRIYCWGFPIIYTSIAIFIDNEQYIMSTSSTSDIGIINIWFSKLHLNNNYDFFFLFPGFINLILNTILFWNTMQFHSQLKLNIINKPIPIIKKLNNLINVRKQLFVLMTILWTVDLLCSFEIIRNLCILWQILHDIRALQGFVTYVILVYRSKLPIRDEWKLRKTKLMQALWLHKNRIRAPVAMASISTTIPK